ncbi:ATP-grasp fold amidoligase family protein [Adlercreutzia faecimuris]|uniref:ATP-grasp fold amidoligase family protein n=1 Tax=Adlercreutzia faecimuris TaxID=2897341 RepID=UPI003D2FFB69
MTSSGLIKNIYRVALNGLASVTGVEFAKKFDARIRFGRKLDLRAPATLADLVNWLELNTDQTLAAQCSDKYVVREYVTSKRLEGILIPLCGGSWTDVRQIDLESLPRSLVLKAAHGCEMNYLCRDKTDIKHSDLERKAKRWLKTECVSPVDVFVGVSRFLLTVSESIWRLNWMGRVDGR